MLKPGMLLIGGRNNQSLAMYKEWAVEGWISSPGTLNFIASFLCCSKQTNQLTQKNCLWVIVFSSSIKKRHNSPHHHNPSSRRSVVRIDYNASTNADQRKGKVHSALDTLVKSARQLVTHHLPRRWGRRTQKSGTIGQQRTSERRHRMVIESAIPMAVWNRCETAH